MVNREFPSLSNTPSQQTQASNSAGSLWAGPNARIGQAAVPRPQQQPLGNHAPALLAQQQQQSQAQQQTQQQQDDLFMSSSQLSNGQGAFRFGGQSAVGQATQTAQSQNGGADEFPPLSRNTNGDLGHDRSGAQNSAFGNAQGTSAFASETGSAQALRGGHLNSLAAGQRVASGGRVASPTSVGGELLCPCVRMIIDINRYIWS